MEEKINVVEILKDSPDCYEFDDELDEYVPKKKGD